MSLEPLYPFASRHAVQSAAFVMAWETPISDAALDEIQALKTNLKSDFGQMHLNQRITFNMLDPTAGISPPGVGGVNFVRGNAPEIARSLIIQEQTVQMSSNDYDRWKSFTNLLNRSFETVVPIAARQRKLASIQLQYIDTFFWKGDPLQLQVSEVFNTKSPFLPANVFELGSDFWHSHSGFFNSKDAPDGCRLLDNVNVQRGPREGSSEHMLTILSSHQLFPSAELWGDQACLAFMGRHLDFLHARNKATLSSLLTEPVQRLISLWSGK